MESVSNKFNNLLDVFVEAETIRSRTYKKDTPLTDFSQIMIRHSIKRKDIDNIQSIHNRIGHISESEAIKLLDLSSAEEYVYNDVLKEIMTQLAVELVRKGVIIVDIQDSEYNINTSELTLTMRCIKPRQDVKLISIRRNKDQ